MTVCGTYKARWGANLWSNACGRIPGPLILPSAFYERLKALGYDMSGYIRNECAPLG